MKSVIVKRVIQFITFPLIITLLLFGIISFLSRVCSSDEVRLQMFYKEEAESLNLALIGPSTARASFLPAKAYENNNLTSYIYAVNTLPICLNKHIVKEIVREQNPELIILDINNVTFPDTITETAAIKTFINSIPDTKDKEDAINELIPENERKNYRNKLYANHGNWTRIGDIFRYYSTDVGHETSKLKGYSGKFYEMNKDEESFIDVSNHSKTKTLPLDNENELLDLLQYLRTNNINVLFIKNPRPVTKESLYETEMLNSAEQIINDYGFNFINFDKKFKEIGLKNKHYYDNTHLNIIGSELFTEYLTNYLISNYTFERTHSDAVKADWDKCKTVMNELISYAKKPESNATKDSSTFVDERFILGKHYNKIKEHKNNKK